MNGGARMHGGLRGRMDGNHSPAKACPEKMQPVSRN